IALSDLCNIGCSVPALLRAGGSGQEAEVQDDFGSYLFTIHSGWREAPFARGEYGCISQFGGSSTRHELCEIDPPGFRYIHFHVQRDGAHQLLASIHRGTHLADRLRRYIRLRRFIQPSQEGYPADRAGET